MEDVVTSAAGIRGLRGDDRVLILGGSGWFGQTLMARLGGAVPVLATASTERAGFRVWDEDVIADFAPTVVAGFAFLTVDRMASVGEDAFLRLNTQMIDRFALSASLPSVRTVLVASSGASIAAPDTPYGALKLREEQVARALGTERRSSVIARAYSVSGPFVREPSTYALSDFIHQARKGAVRVTATRPVFRRYCAVDDFLAVSLTLGLSGWSGVVESGGPMVEIGELAQRVIEVVNPAALLSRAPLLSDEPSVYASDDSSWTAACRQAEITPLGLDAQIRSAAQVALP